MDQTDQVPYVPPGELAAKAVANHPQKSNRAIAKMLGVSYETVRRARQELGSSINEPKTRTGLDGKERHVPHRRAGSH
jgi:Homeodomain-like domain